MEQHAAPAQAALLQQLGRTGGPGKLIAPVAPDVADDEDGQRDVRQRNPAEKIERAHRATPSTAGGVSEALHCSDAAFPGQSARLSSSLASARKLLPVGAPASCRQRGPAGSRRTQDGVAPSVL